MPGSAHARLLDAGLQLFSAQPYDQVEVGALAAQAGVTSGALYHHFRSKPGLYGVLRDEMTLRLLDRIEAATDLVPPTAQLKVAVLTAYDGVFRIRAGHLLIDPDPRALLDRLTAALTGAARRGGVFAPEVSAQLLSAALRAALQAGHADPQAQSSVRQALHNLMGGL
jgi:AcrR family transcriptional regulator